MILGIRGWNIEFILRQIHNDVPILLSTNCDGKSACQRAISWARQSLGSMKLNVDGSCLDQDLHSRFGGVIYYYNGSWILFFLSLLEHACPILRAELMRIRHGLALTGDRGFK
ncbi:hypothetical protein RIF29_28435 [Crotalaria pallida]|uniref:RNase H type-1 domain-containing protein n=1 Tax=Crotalaria pallida TaxID=3830 RepID=A0AAN9EJC9_CROPI